MQVERSTSMTGANLRSPLNQGQENLNQQLAQFLTQRAADGANISKLQNTITPIKIENSSQPDPELLSPTNRKKIFERLAQKTEDKPPMRESRQYRWQVNPMPQAAMPSNISTPKASPTSQNASNEENAPALTPTEMRTKLKDLWGNAGPAGAPKPATPSKTKDTSSEKTKKDKDSDYKKETMAPQISQPDPDKEASFLTIILAQCAKLINSIVAKFFEWFNGNDSGESSTPPPPDAPPLTFNMPLSITTNFSAQPLRQDRGADFAAALAAKKAQGLNKVQNK